MGRVPGEIQTFHLKPGRTYLVIGLQFSVNSNVLGTGAWVHVVNEDGKLSWAPFVLFEVTDPRVSSLWRVDATTDGQLRLWPELLYTPYFHDDLGEGDPVATQKFEHLLRVLETEH